jgi:hypothetical protein
VLAYLSDGRRLRSENIRELAGVQDQVRETVSPSVLLFTDDSDDICLQQAVSGTGPEFSVAGSTS